MTNLLMTYFLHSTVLLATTWLVLRIARPGSPVLIERVWKLAAVLPIVTALAIACHPVVVTLAARETAEANVIIETASDPLNEMPQIALPDEAVLIYDKSPQPAEPAIEDDPLLDASFAADVANEPQTSLEIGDDWRMGTLARPPDEELILHGTGKSAHPPSDAVVVDETAIAGADGSPDILVESDAELRPERSKPWPLPVWQFASTLLPTSAVLGAVWLAIRSTWFRWRLRNARRVERGRIAELLAELQVAITRRGGLLTWDRLPACQSRQETRQAGSLSHEGSQTRRVTATRTPQIRVLIAPSFAEPAAFGIWQPTIVLPPSCESLDRDALRAVLAHELGHIARRDLWWLAIGRVLTTVFGFQPLNRIARREWTRAAECLCDDWAVGRGVERLTLARCLTAFAEHRLTGVSLADALAAVGSPSTLRTRVERLVSEPVADPWSYRSRRWLVTSVVVVVATVMATTLPLPEFASAPAVADDEPDETLVGKIETELSGLRTELQQAARLAEERGDPDWLDAAESLRVRERRIVEQWKSFRLEGAEEGSKKVWDADRH